MRIPSPSGSRRPSRSTSGPFGFVSGIVVASMTARDAVSSGRGVRGSMVYQPPAGSGSAISKTMRQDSSQPFAFASSRAARGEPALESAVDTPLIH